jgi:hypothetical protein
MREAKCDVTGLPGLRQVLFGLCMAAMVVISQTAEAAGTAATKTSATRLIYHEIEEGIEAYDNQYLFTDRYLRISDPDDDSGYILFDANENKIYSVSHFDKSILVVPEYPLKEIKKTYRDVISFDKLHDAPSIDGRPVYSYRGEAVSPDGGKAQLCTDIQLVPDLLPATADMLRRYMQVLSSQQQTDLEKTPPELRTPCFLQDQVFNTGEYYRKGLPVREWHSNGKQRLLLDFGEVEVDSSLFVLPTDYRRFSIEQSGQVPQAPSL